MNKTTTKKTNSKKSADKPMALHAYIRNGKYTIQLCPYDAVDEYHAEITPEQRSKFTWDVANSRFRQEYDKYGVDTRDYHIYKYWRTFIAENHA